MYFIINSVFGVTVVNCMASLGHYNKNAVTPTTTALSFLCYAINDLLYFIFGRHLPVVPVSCWQTNPQIHKQLNTRKINIYEYI